jgi:hypothetical protein
MSTAQKQPWRVILAIAGLVTGAIAMLTSPARADTFIFDDLTESPTLTHTGIDTKVTGSCGIIFEACINQITVSRPGQTFNLPPNISPDGLIFAEDPQLQFVSDQISADPSSGFISFSSLPEGITEMCTDFKSGCQLQENGQLQGFSISWSGGGSDDAIMIRSDVEGVPEPASWLLLATGLVGLLGVGLHRRPWPRDT